MELRDIQLGDIITVYNEYYKETGEYTIIFIPDRPGLPWVVREAFGDLGRKWTIHTEGQFTRTFTRTTYE